MEDLGGRKATAEFLAGLHWYFIRPKEVCGGNRVGSTKYSVAKQHVRTSTGCRNTYTIEHLKVSPSQPQWVFQTHYTSIANSPGLLETKGRQNSVIWAIFPLRTAELPLKQQGWETRSKRNSLKAEFPWSSKENWCIFQDHFSVASIIFLEARSKAQLLYIKIHNTINQMMYQKNSVTRKLILYPLQ